jgi:hypothetical protein
MQKGVSLMEAPRNWRNKVQRYRLTGVQYSNGESSLLNRPHAPESQEAVELETAEEIREAQVSAA